MGSIETPTPPQSFLDLSGRRREITSRQPACVRLRRKIETLIPPIAAAGPSPSARPGDKGIRRCPAEPAAGRLSRCPRWQDSLWRLWRLAWTDVLRAALGGELVRAAGAVRTVAGFLGRSDPALTRRVYGHALAERNQAAAAIRCPRPLNACSLALALPGVHNPCLC